MSAPSDLLADLVQASTTDPRVSWCWQRAVELVDHHAGSKKASIPTGILDLAYREVGADLFHRSHVRLGVVGLTDTELGQPIRVSSDALASVRRMLRPFLGLGMA